MKRVLTMLLMASVALAGVVSCEKSDEQEQTTVNTSFVGLLDVGSGAYTDSAASFDVTKEGDQISILMNGIKFSSYMPVTLDITISDLALSSDGSFAAESIIPTVAGVPMEDYTMSDVSGTYTTSALTVEFTCYKGTSTETTATFSGTK